MCKFDICLHFHSLYLRLCICLFGGGLGLLWMENIPPSHNLCDPAVSLPTAIYFFTPHTAASSPISQTDTHTCSHNPCSPPKLLGKEQGDPGPMKQAVGGGQPGENLPWFSLLKLFSSGWQICSDTSTRGDRTELRGWGRTTIICPPLMLVKLFFMLARREGLKYN